VAIAYHLHKTPYVFPIVGGRKVENLQKNLETLEITLSKEQMVLLESVLPFDVGFPNWLIVHGFLACFFVIIQHLLLDFLLALLCLFRACAN
jgi:hypothetical protein